MDGSSTWFEGEDGKAGSCVLICEEGEITSIDSIFAVRVLLARQKLIGDVSFPSIAHVFEALAPATLT